jgi:predicted DNA-binding transcriptional regulator AlpA
VVALVQLPSRSVGRRVDLDDLLDAVDVAELLGLSSATAVATYRRRYDDFPEPAWASRGGRCQLWLRGDIARWDRSRSTAR